MTDYIKREDAQRITAEWLSGYIYDEQREVLEKVEVELGELPSADVVDVVRCKDCKYHAEFSSKCNKLHLTPMRPNYYCSFGERREE